MVAVCCARNMLKVRYMKNSRNSEGDSLSAIQNATIGRRYCVLHRKYL